MTDHHPPPRRAASDGAPAALPAPARAPARRQFVHPPQTRAEASRAIDALKRRAPEPAADRRREIRGVQDDLARGRGDDARVIEGLETTGYGSSARWVHGTPRADR